MSNDLKAKEALSVELEEQVREFKQEVSALVASNEALGSAAEKKIQLELALKGDELESAFGVKCVKLEEVITELKRENETLNHVNCSLQVECERLNVRCNKAESNEKELRHAHSILQADLNTFATREEMRIRTVVTTMESEKRELVTSHEHAIGLLRQECKKQVVEKEGKEVRLKECIDKLRKDIKSDAQAYDQKILTLNEEKEILRNKWQSSITNKRAAQKTHNRLSQKRLSVEAADSTVQTENSSRNCKPKRMKQVEAKSRQVASRFMQPKERFR